MLDCASTVKHEMFDNALTQLARLPHNVYDNFDFCLEPTTLTSKIQLTDIHTRMQ